MTHYSAADYAAHRVGHLVVGERHRGGTLAIVYRRAWSQLGKSHDYGALVALLAVEQPRGDLKKSQAGLRVDLGQQCAQVDTAQIQRQRIGQNSGQLASEQHLNYLVGGGAWSDNPRANADVRVAYITFASCLSRPYCWVLLRAASAAKSSSSELSAA
ncbi:hypothetical protein [Pseudomonas sp. G3-19]